MLEYRQDIHEYRVGKCRCNPSELLAFEWSHVMTPAPDTNSCNSR